ncbi:MAG: hypothetical protein AAB466_08610, partial [Verrucomicrobiota bacterium]
MTPPQEGGLLLYRRFPIGSASEVRERVWIGGVRRLEALRHSSNSPACGGVMKVWETCIASPALFTGWGSAS